MNKRPSSSDLNIISNCDTADSLESITNKKLLLAPKISFKTSHDIDIPEFILNLSTDITDEYGNDSFINNKEAIVKDNNHEQDDINLSFYSDNNYICITEKGNADINYNKQPNGIVITSIISKLSSKKDFIL